MKGEKKYSYGGDPWRELMRGVVRRAGQEAKAGEVDAIYWLKDQAILDSFVLAAGLDCRAVKALAQAAEGRVIQEGAQRIIRELAKHKQRRSKQRLSRGSV